MAWCWRRACPRLVRWAGLGLIGLGWVGLDWIAADLVSSHCIPLYPIPSIDSPSHSSTIPGLLLLLLLLLSSLLLLLLLLLLLRLPRQRKTTDTFGPKLKAFREALAGDAADVLSDASVAADETGLLGEVRALRGEVTAFCRSFPTVGFEAEEMTYKDDGIPATATVGEEAQVASQ